MSYAAIQHLLYEGFDLEFGTKSHVGHLVGIVLPGGCNLSCPYCAIAQRRERGLPIRLTAEHFMYFANSLKESDDRLLGLAIVGDEPCRDTTWSTYTLPILKHLDSIEIPSGMVTNGTLLADKIPDLVNTNIVSLAVSIDGHQEYHDSIRGEGSFAASMTGLRAATTSLRPEQCMIASVLQPKRIHVLTPLIDVIAELGITEWVLSPLIRFNPELPMERRVADASSLLHELSVLSDTAEKKGVRVSIDDEFRVFGNDYAMLDALNVQVLRRDLAVDLVRLTYDGSLQVNHDILEPISDTTMKWDVTKDPAEMIITIAAGQLDQYQKQQSKKVA